MKYFIFAALLVFTPLNAQSEIVKQVNSDGSITYVNIHTAPTKKEQTVKEDPNLGDEVDGIKIYDISSKVVKRSSNYVYVGLKAKVKNLTENQEVRLKIEALDRNGFQLENTYVTGFVRPGKIGYLTRQRMVQKDIFPQIKEWRVKP